MRSASRAAEGCQCFFAGAPPLGAPGRLELISFLALACTPCRWELSRLLSSITGRQAAKALRELAGTGVPLVVRGGGLEGLVPREHVPGGDQDLERDRGLGRVAVAGAAADVEVEVVPGVRFAPG